VKGDDAMSAAVQVLGLRFSGARIPSPVPIAFGLIVFELAAMLLLGGGRFSYILDDPYIHLAVSEELSRGGYGINPGEAASPSSSILWPILLAPFSGFDWHRHVPLILNTGLALAAAGTLSALLNVGLGGQGPAALRNGLAIILVLVGGIVPLVFSGMEHLLQAWLALLCVLGAIDAQQQRGARWWLWVALAAAPLVRYESLGMTLSFAVLLWTYGYRKQVAATLAITAALLVAFSLLLISQDLPFLPSSILAKAALTRGDMTARDTVVALIRSILAVNILVTLTGLLLLVALLAQQVRGVALALAAATVLHFTFGSYGIHFGRYESYLLIPGFALMAIAGTASLRALAERRGLHVALLAAALFATPLWPGAVRACAYMPLAGDNIGSQQREMHRFATEFVKGPVAVNDLGLVSYRNDHSVLDLWGLGSEEARQKRMSGAQGWAAPLLDSHDVSVMMIYETWVGTEVPSDWIALGQLELTRKQITPAEPTVHFFARPDRAAELKQQVRLFAAGLPDGARFRLAE
jgi:hypothetical protein